MDIVTELKKLNLPKGQYAVVASGVLDVKGIRRAKDIDLLVTQEVYDSLKKRGWREEQFVGTLREWVLFEGPFDVSTSWSVEGFEPEPAKIMREAEIIDGIPFARLEEVLTWKKAAKRPKDLQDIELIEAYLAKQ